MDDNPYQAPQTPDPPPEPTPQTRISLPVGVSILLVWTVVALLIRFGVKW